MLHSENVPDVTYSPDINDLFHYFAINWDTLSPVAFLLYGVLIGFFFLTIIFKKFFGE